jgi:hypothetical protein
MLNFLNEKLPYGWEMSNQKGLTAKAGKRETGGVSRPRKGKTVSGMLAAKPLCICAYGFCGDCGFSK